MDLNGDGNVDILSGSYSRMEQDMAGTFQVLWGNEDKTFSAAQTLNGNDDQPLVIPGSREENMTDRICTRAFAVDLNNDGLLDIVTGNFTGSFFVFLGTGKGEFSPECSILKAGDEPLMVQGHSDPFMIDWDGDGDFDLLSGSGAGGVILSTNLGSKSEPEFSEPVTLVPPFERVYDPNRFGDAHVTAPQSSTRVWADDINQDGKLDLLVGDSVQLTYTVDGVTEDEARAKLADWGKEYAELMAWWAEASKDLDHEAFAKLQMRKRASENSDEENGEETEDDLSEEELASLDAYNKTLDEYRKRSDELYQRRNEVVRLEMTGFVWLLYQQ